MLIVFIRAILLYIIITFCTRLMGKRQLGEFQPSELVTTILISNIATLPMEDISIPMLFGVIPILVLVGFELLVSNISLRFRPFRYLMSGKPLLIIKNGVIDQKQLRKLRFSIDDLMEALRQNSIFDVADVLYAVAETNGKVSIMQTFQSQTVTAKMMNLKEQKVPLPLVIISDGTIIPESMKRYHVTQDWLNKVLKADGHSPKDIFLMTIDQEHTYHIVAKQQEGNTP